VVALFTTSLPQQQPLDRMNPHVRAFRFGSPSRSMSNRMASQTIRATGRSSRVALPFTYAASAAGNLTFTLCDVDMTYLSHKAQFHVKNYFQNNSVLT